jgi:hypothetical protein
MLPYATPAIRAQVGPYEERDTLRTPARARLGSPAPSWSPDRAGHLRDRGRAALPPPARAALSSDPVAQAVEAAAALGWAGGARREPGPSGGPGAHAGAGRGHGAGPPGRSSGTGGHAAGRGQGPLGAGRAPILTAGYGLARAEQEDPRQTSSRADLAQSYPQTLRAGWSPRPGWLSSAHEPHRAHPVYPLAGHQLPGQGPLRRPADPGAARHIKRRPLQRRQGSGRGTPGARGETPARLGRFLCMATRRPGWRACRQRGTSHEGDVRILTVDGRTTTSTCCLGVSSSTHGCRLAYELLALLSVPFNPSFWG